MCRFSSIFIFSLFIPKHDNEEALLLLLIAEAIVSGCSIVLSMLSGLETRSLELNTLGTT